MNDNFEKFIQDHRDEFDPYEPSEKVWPRINRELSRKHYRIRPVYYAIAASVLFIAIGCIWFMKPSTQKFVSANNDNVVVIPEINEAEIYYASLVATKRTEISELGKAYPDLSKDFDAEIDTLHALYGQLKIEYKNSNGNEAVLQAMIQNLQMQVQLLTTQFRVIQNVKQKEGNRNRNSKLM